MAARTTCQVCAASYIAAVDEQLCPSCAHFEATRAEQDQTDPRANEQRGALRPTSLNASAA